MISFSIEDSRLLQYAESFNQDDPATSFDELNIMDGSGFQEVSLDEQITIPLRVVRSSGFDITPDYNITVSD